MSIQTDRWTSDIAEIRKHPLYPRYLAGLKRHPLRDESGEFRFSDPVLSDVLACSFGLTQDDHSDVSGLAGDEVALLICPESGTHICVHRGGDVEHYSTVITVDAYDSADLDEVAPWAFQWALNECEYGDE